VNPPVNAASGQRSTSTLAVGNPTQTAASGPPASTATPSGTPQSTPPSPVPKATRADQGTTSETAGATAALSDLVLQVAATDRAWVAVDADGKTVLQKVLNPNEVENLKAHDSFDVTVGNAQGVVLTLNGETLKPLGRRGEVKSIHLTREDLKNPALER